MKKYLSLLFVLACILSNAPIQAQAYDPVRGCLVDPDTDECLPNSLLSAVPFLRINPDARTGAMGDVGLATSVDANSMHFNASKLAFADYDMSISATYTPWLQGIGLKDVYLAYLSGYKRINDLQTIGFDLRFFSLGQIDFTDANGNPRGSGKPREFALSFAYARKLSDDLSTAITARYIYSDLASGQQVENIDITAANGFAVDLSLSYGHDITLGDYDSRLDYGLAVTNLGSKVTYTKSIDVRDFLPANIGIGAALEMNIDEYNSLTFAADINKLLVPTPIPFESDEYDTDGNDIADFREKNLLEGALGSFGDAPGGAIEELQEIYYSAGLEYWYDKQFAVRTGYYHEHRRKGSRRFLTVGIGLKYNTLNMNISYLVPTSLQRTPLDNTLRFGIIFNLAEVEE